MAKFVIEPHFRLQEWVAEEKGYFRDEGLDYEFREFIRATGGAHHLKGDKVGAFQSIEQGRTSNVTCACHWTVNVAASRGHTKLYADAYSVAPSAIFVPADSKAKSPADLAGVPFGEGMLFGRMEAFLDGKSPACTLFSGPYYFAEQLGFRKIIDNTFMISTMINGDPDPEDIAKFFRALRCAQRDIDVRPELYTHYYKAEFPERFHARMDTRAWGPGERIVFEPYTREVYEQSFAWVANHQLFEVGGMGEGRYEDAILSRMRG